MIRLLRTITAPLAAGTLACLLLSGCHVTNNKNGNKDNVDIGTPFGSMQVKTDNGSDTSAIGLSAYPGAVPVKEDNDKNANSADINMSFGGFHLGVKAAGFQTTDSQDKVLAFYRKDMAKYGDIIECKGGTAVGQPTHTAQGLTCNTSHNDNVHTFSADGSSVELRAGSELHQHIVGLEQKDGGTKIGLVMLDLPSHLMTHDKSESQ
jgi:hypothetical protein